MKKYFYLDESIAYPEKFMIKLNHDYFCFPNGTSGSYNVFIARVLDLTYADYLRFARDILGGEIVGKKHKYPLVIFDRNANLQAFMKMINKRMEYIMYIKEHPYNIVEKDNGELEKIPIDFSKKVSLENL